MRAGDGPQALFIVHPAEGAVLGYAQLAERLEEGRPVYGLQAPGLEGEALPLESVEQMATQYLGAIRTVQPEGPYLLAGWSFGGLVAFEMAQQLHAAGEQVDWLGLMDSFVLSGAGEEPIEKDPGMFASGAGQFLEQLGLDLPIPQEELAEHAPAEQVEMILQGLADSGVAIPDAMTRQARNLLKIWNINAAAGQRYEPQSYCGEITFFRAAEDEANIGDWGPNPIEQWQQLAESSLAVHRVPGTHTSMMLDPQNVEVLAERLQESLDHAQAKC